eukprot:1908874-Rhodomonas_salina.1
MPKSNAITRASGPKCTGSAVFCAFDFGGCAIVPCYALRATCFSSAAPCAVPTDAVRFWYQVMEDRARHVKALQEGSLVKLSEPWLDFVDEQGRTFWYKSTPFCPARPLHAPYVQPGTDCSGQ